jgi:hypothetical protein
VSERKGPACPESFVLQQALEGSLPAREQAEVMAHVEHCASCRSVKDTLDRVVVFYASDASDASSERRYAKFLDAVEERKSEREPEEMRRVRRMPRRWMPVALVPLGALLAFCVCIFIAPPSQAVVQADELIARAARAEQTQRIDLVQRVRTRLTPQARQPIEWTYEASANGSASIVSAAATPLQLALRMTQGGERALPFDGRSPLAVARFHLWRAALPQKRDVVSIVGPCYVLRTTTTSGHIREAEIAVTRDGFHVVRLSWVIDWIGRLDIEELEAWVRPADPPRLVDRDGLERAELAARLALRAGDWDLGAIQVRPSQTPDAVAIEGVVSSASARDALVARLTAIPQIRLDVRVEPGAVPRPSRPSAEWLAAYGAGASDRAALVPEITRRAPRVAQRLVAIQALADRYTPEIVAALPADAQATLRRLVDAHFTALHTDMTALDDQLATFIGSAGRPIPPAHPPREWRACTRRALHEARALSALLTPATAPVPTEIRVHLDALWRHLNPPAQTP